MRYNVSCKGVEKNDQGQIIVGDLSVIVQENRKTQESFVRRIVYERLYPMQKVLLAATS
ncbi:hypothetical protein JG687_00017221 [Phytophthora cactorum]|uniref:Uncharacterized protein n=1 Tax=Phytophthora cactorum TaxID=29920 RepID=A0A8T1TT22_9STRA|nr:hypothetical protein JG687_00017221 [Phytophthora cactorum]